MRLSAVSGAIFLAFASLMGGQDAQADDNCVSIVSVEKSRVHASVASFVSEAYDLAEVCYTIDPMPTQRALFMVRSGIADADLVRVKEFIDAQPSYTNVPTPIRRVSGYILAREDVVLDRVRKGDFSGLTIARLKGFRWQHFIGKSLGVTTMEVDSNQQALELTNLGRVDGMLVNEVSHRIFEVSGMLDGKNLRPSVHLIDLTAYHVVKKNRPDLIAKLDRAFLELHESGRADELLERWMRSIAFDTHPD